jgi:AraC-like DNA-binding protein
MTAFSSSPHACAFFSSPEAQRRFLSRFLKEGIEGGYRVIYTTPPIAPATVEAQLEEAGIDVGHSCQTGSLMMQNWDVSYCPDGHFVPSRTLRFFDNQVRDALESGYSRVRFASHMEWAVADAQFADTLLEYEARANEERAHKRSVAQEVLCVYDASRFDAAFLTNVMRTHPFTILDGEIFENPFYVPPADFLKELRARRAGSSRLGLAPWQLRRVTALLMAISEKSPSVNRLAQECGLSTRHFSRAFARSTGLPPHRWVLERRIEMAKRLLMDPAKSLTDVALACGFASQSHFTRAFSGRVGRSPGAWRRARG